jgi:hypothetical protein
MAVLGTKLVPVTTRVNGSPAAGALVGETLVAVGAGLLTVKVNGLVAPPPGLGLVTVTDFAPPFAISDAAIMALTWVELTRVVV